MNFKATEELLRVLAPYTDNSDITVDSESKNSDFVMIDEKHNVGFDVMDNEIIVFYFTDHYHFEDYTSEPADDENDYIKRAKEFLIELFRYKLRHIEYYKGKSLASEKYYIIYDDGRDEEYLGGTWLGLSKLINPFGKKTSQSTTWQYDRSKGCFTNRQPKPIDPRALESLDVNEDCYIEIFKDHGVYTYGIMEIRFDEYFGMYYWAPMVDAIPSGFYDTKEKAVEVAKEALKCR